METAIAQQEGETDGITKCNKVLRDIAFNLIAVGRNTISTGLILVFLACCNTHPYVETKIVKEIKEYLLDNGEWKVLKIDEVS